MRRGFFQITAVVHPAQWCRVLFTWEAGLPAGLAVLLSFWLAGGMSGQAAPAYPLKASANGRYLVDSNHVPVLLTGDSPQALLVKLTAAEAGLFLTNRASLGFNSLWVNLLCTTNNGGLPGGLTTNGIAPFTNTIPGTSAYDLTAPNEAYFAHVDRVIRLAAGLGIQIMLGPLETSVGVWTSVAVTNGTNRCRAYGQYLGQRYRDFDNLIWWSGNDFQDWTDPASDAVVRAVAEGIRDADTRHLHTLMLDYPVSGSLDSPNWWPILGLNGSYTYWPTYAQVLADYNRTNFLPTFMSEAHYEGELLYDAYGTPEVMRRQAYWALLSGACGQFMGNHFTWQFLAGWQTNLNTPGSVQMAHVKSLFESQRWYDLVPDQDHAVVTAGFGTFATGGSLTNNDYATAARTPDGALVLVYMPTPRTLTLNMAQLGAAATARWFDPVNGQFASIAGSPFTNSGSRTFTPNLTNSGGSGDWVLVLETPAADIVPPAAPSGLTAVAVGLNQINLQWNPATDNFGISGYRIQRCTGEGCADFVDITVATTNVFADVGVPAATWARYRVQALDTMTNGSEFSAVAVAKTWTPAVEWSGLAASYAFEEGAGSVAADSSGNHNTAWLAGPVWGVGGKFGGGIELDGATSLVVSNSASLMLSNQLTIAAWFSPAAPPAGEATVLARSAGPTFAYRLKLDGSNRPVFSINTAAGGAQSVVSPSSLPLSLWSHVAGTYDGATLQLWINGAVVASTNVAGELVGTAEPLLIGGNLSGGVLKLDELRLYNRALTASEIQSGAGLPRGAAPTVSLVGATNLTGGFGFRLSANLPAVYVVEATTDFRTWVPLTTVQYTNSEIAIVDPGVPLPSAAYYRVATPNPAASVSLVAPPQSGAEIALNGFRLNVTAAAPALLGIERSTDLVNWQPIATLAYTNGPMWFIDPPVALLPYRFYRARWW